MTNTIPVEELVSILPRSATYVFDEALSRTCQIILPAEDLPHVARQLARALLAQTVKHSSGFTVYCADYTFHLCPNIA